ncbi:hypothetical protein SO802_014375 [Lithocarpus litseifolius]|uniref:Uncharacterized protein n=1 Tax=Lithocarpus litseifolius TaxID=425828 RepID=A0AAW2CSY9_9ROSI
MHNFKLQKNLNFDGKRKERAELDSNLITGSDAMGKYISRAKPNGLFQTEFCVSGPLGQFNKGLEQTKSGVASVRGKKEIARNRASANSPRSAVSKKEGLLTKADWEATISKLQPGGNGGFKFCSKARPEVGNQHRGADCGDSFSKD